MGPKKGPVFAKQMAAAHAWQYVPRKCFSIQRWRFTSTKYKYVMSLTVITRVCASKVCHNVC